MGTTVPLTESRVFAVPVEEAFDRILPMPLNELFVHRYGPLPPVRATMPKDGWGTPGQRRTVMFTGPGSVQEELLSVERPHRFRYRLSRPTGPLALLVAGLQGDWTFDPDGAGTRITWAWDVEPRNRVGRAAMPVFARLWHGYARATFTRLDELLS